MNHDRRVEVDVSTFKIYKEVTDDKIDALFLAIKEVNARIDQKVDRITEKLDMLLLNQAKGQALAIIGKWCLILIPAIAAMLGVIAVWRS